MSLLGIDVSHYQGDVDWFAVARSGVSFAFAKTSEGNSYVDTTFRRNWQLIQEAGLFRGAYHFARPGRDPETQAALFASVLGGLGFRDLPPVLDLEEDDGRSAGEVLDWAQRFVTKAEQLLGRTLMIYTGGFWRGPLGNPTSPFFSARPLWLAAYVTSPVVPASWTSWTFWQYSEGRHNRPVPIAGVRPCDQNRFAGTEADLDRLCGLTPSSAPASVAAAEADAWPGIFFVWPHTPALSDPAISRWQKRMAELGYDVDVDGVYGPQSRAACVAFQRERGLSPDGIVGRVTWRACFT